jgi:hypothetical protein
VSPWWSTPTRTGPWRGGRAIIGRTAQALAGPHDDLLARLRGARALHMDETSWRTAGERRALCGSLAVIQLWRTISPVAVGIIRPVARRRCNMLNCHHTGSCTGFDSQQDTLRVAFSASPRALPPGSSQPGSIEQRLRVIRIRDPRLDCRTAKLGAISVTSGVLDISLAELEAEIEGSSGVVGARSRRASR